MNAYRRRVEAFGCAAVVVDGHVIAQIDAALAAARQAEPPMVVLAKTVDGKGFPEIEDKNGWHGKPLPAESGAGGRNGWRCPARPSPRSSARTRSCGPARTGCATRAGLTGAAVAAARRPAVMAANPGPRQPLAGRSRGSAGNPGLC